MTDYRFPGDEAVLLALNGLDWPWLDAIFVAASSRTFGVTTAVVLSLWLLAVHRRKAARAVVQAVLACVLADAFGHNVLKPLFHRMRPSAALANDGVRLFTDASASGHSMPSLHAATAFAFVIGLGLALPSTLRLTLPLAVLIALSRIGVSVHWPSDVVVGGLYGAAVAWGLDRVFQRVWRDKPASTAPAPT